LDLRAPIRGRVLGAIPAAALRGTCGRAVALAAPPPPNGAKRRASASSTSHSEMPRYISLAGFDRIWR